MEWAQQRLIISSRAGIRAGSFLKTTYPVIPPVYKIRRCIGSFYVGAINGDQISAEFSASLHEQSDARQKPLQRFCRAMHVVFIDRVSSCNRFASCQQGPLRARGPIAVQGTPVRFNTGHFLCPPLTRMNQSVARE